MTWCIFIVHYVLQAIVLLKKMLHLPLVFWFEFFFWYLKHYSIVWLIQTPIPPINNLCQLVILHCGT